MREYLQEEWTIFFYKIRQTLMTTIHKVGKKLLINKKYIEENCLLMKAVTNST